jgi:type IV pilus assembly protein PilV
MPANKRNEPVAAAAQCRGTSMLEVLITILILSVGMLGLAALQGKAHTSELESYQRGQALVLLQDIASRMEGNMANAASYITAGAGTGASDAGDCTTLGARAAVDLCEWSKALKGSSEAKGSTKQGAMIDGRGCVASSGTNVYLISVVWQGLGATVAPATGCGQGLYDSEATRRAVTLTFRVPDLWGE